MANAPEITTIDQYIAQYPPEVQQRMRELRRVIHEAAPEAGEKISWGMATFTLHGNLVHFAGQTKHLGFYPGADGVEHFLPKLGDYKTSKGGIQLPYDKPMPWPLIKQIVAFRAKQQVGEFEAKERAKQKAKAEKSSKK